MDRFCLQACAKIYTEYAQEFSLPKSFVEMVKDFEAVFGGFITRSTLAGEIAVLFRAYVVDYLPIWKQKQEKEKEKERAEKVKLVSEKPKPKTPQEKAKEMYVNGASFVQIGKELGVSDKTAKKYVAEV